jgi:hypothetical protein
MRDLEALMGENEASIDFFISFFSKAENLLLHMGFSLKVVAFCDPCSFCLLLGVVGVH